MEENDRVIEPAAESAEAPAADPAALLANLAAERDEVARQRDEYYDRLLRRTADLENFRRRVERERAELLEFAGMEAAGELLPVLDDFERALKVNAAGAEYAKGMELIYQRFLEALKKLGLEPMETQGAKFDPHLHHAVEMVQTEEVEDHTIIEEFRRGYSFKGRLLRPALVKVAVKP
ncbi:MAG: nucleotide exchange factor GrpE [Acidobacteriota bacterium]